MENTITLDCIAQCVAKPVVGKQWGVTNAAIKRRKNWDKSTAFLNTEKHSKYRRKAGRYHFHLFTALMWDTFSDIITFIRRVHPFPSVFISGSVPILRPFKHKSFICIVFKLTSNLKLQSEKKIKSYHINKNCFRPDGSTSRVLVFWPKWF